VKLLLCRTLLKAQHSPRCSIRCLLQTPENTAISRSTEDEDWHTSMITTHLHNEALVNAFKSSFNNEEWKVSKSSIPASQFRNENKDTYNNPHYTNFKTTRQIARTWLIRSNQHHTTQSQAQQKKSSCIILAPSDISKTNWVYAIGSYILE